MDEVRAVTPLVPQLTTATAATTLVQRERTRLGKPVRSIVLNATML